ncbi:MAG: fumarylacetoacetate hydrolase family protein [Planctomycetota bacterium]|jgi:2-keto-4-pentenoate hydratase/2-oxohepta-3-ene-1,7-dioic acid hydratase in catechol pathway
MAKFIRFKAACIPDEAYGEVKDDIINILDSSPLTGGKETGESCPLDAVEEYLPPIAPENIIAIGANYAEHCKESDAELPDHPLIFIKLSTALTGHEQNIILPKSAPDNVDYEAELVAVIGKEAKNISEEEALSYVFGYAIGNDVSARDCQKTIDRQWARGKSFDTFAPVGPCLITDFDNPMDKKISFRLNGKTMQDSNTKYMIFNLPYLISYLSHQFTLIPGTMIFTGTPDGVGMAQNPPQFLKEGDVCEVEIEGLGILKNTVIKE